MASLFVTIDILYIGKHKLNINEYLTLLKYYHDEENKTFPFVPDERYFEALLRDGFMEQKEDGSYGLGDEGRKLFYDTEDLFEEFYSTFPHKVPTGYGFRPVSTKDPAGVSAKATRAIWDRMTKGKPGLQRTIITNLKRELAHKKASNSLAFLQNIDTWLRQATWEKWEDIPDKQESSGYKKL